MSFYRYIYIYQIIIVYEPPEESRIQRKFRKKTIFNSLYVQWRHQKGLHFTMKSFNRILNIFFMKFPCLDKNVARVSRKDFVLFLGYHELLDNHVYSFSWLDAYPCWHHTDHENFWGMKISGWPSLALNNISFFDDWSIIMILIFNKVFYRFWSIKRFLKYVTVLSYSLIS